MYPVLMAECSLWGVISSAATTRDITWSHVPVLEVATSCVLGSAACSARHFKSESSDCLPPLVHGKHQGARGTNTPGEPCLDGAPVPVLDGSGNRLLAEAASFRSRFVSRSTWISADEAAYETSDDCDQGQQLLLLISGTASWGHLGLSFRPPFRTRSCFTSTD